jgi:hypothetical protein
MGYVYLLLEIDRNSNETYKIGVTKKDPNLRLKQLQTGNPNELRVLRFYESDNYLKVEKWLHRKYGYLKTVANNEWRMLDTEHVFSFIEDCTEADELITFLQNNNQFYN